MIALTCVAHNQAESVVNALHEVQLKTLLDCSGAISAVIVTALVLVVMPTILL